MNNKSYLSILILAVLILNITLISAHEEGNETSIEEQAQELRPDHNSSFSPIVHWKSGNYGAAIFIIVFWGLALKGFFDLILLLIGKHLK